MQKRTLTKERPQAEVRIKSQTPTLAPVWIIAVMVIGAGLLALI